jgi:hypothetical protein
VTTDTEKSRGAGCLPTMAGVVAALAGLVVYLLG